jgi:hypothetical protein
MISQEFLKELELAMLRGYGKATNQTMPRGQREANFLGSAQYKEEFVKHLMSVLEERKAVLAQSIMTGGHNPVKIIGKLYPIIENKVREELTRNSLNYKTMNEKSFGKVIQDVKKEIPDLFYVDHKKK